MFPFQSTQSLKITAAQVRTLAKLNLPMLGEFPIGREMHRPVGESRLAVEIDGDIVVIEGDGSIK